MLHALIMAGGSGTRFWPASRDLTPKQLLKLSGDRTMIQATVDRLAGLVPAEQTLILTNAKLVDAVREQLPELPKTSVLGEPCKRDTAPCVGLAAALFAARHPDATMVVLPADHVISTVEQFQLALRTGLRLIEERPTRFVTFGIKPSYPAESFGYVERDAPLATKPGEPAAYTVKQFREKPNRPTAEAYVASGRYYWNGGIFMWRAKALLDALRKYEPAIADAVQSIADDFDKPNFATSFAEKFAAIKGKSIDYAVMEHYTDVAVVEAPFRWDDVGSWQAIARLQAADAAGNVVRGSHVGIDTQGSIIQTESGHLIVTIGIDDLIVVQAGNATLVAPKHAEERVREAVAAMRERGLESFL